MRVPHPSHAPATITRGFTLIELLVVMAIIATLLAITIPALGAARQQVYKAKCLNHQKQLIAATTMFATDHDGLLPLTGNESPPIPNWLENPATATKTPDDAKAGQLWSYLNHTGVYRCPSDRGPWTAGQIQNVSSYVMNGCCCDFQPCDQTNFKIISLRGDAIIFWENPPLAAGVIGDDPTNNPPDGIAAWHNHGTTIGCLDGHAEVLSVQQFSDECSQPGPSRLWCDPAQGDGGVSQWISDENGGQPVPSPVFSQP